MSRPKKRDEPTADDTNRTDSSVWLNAKHAGARYGMAGDHFRRLARAGRVPPGVRLISSRPLWRLSDLLEWERKVAAAQCTK